MIEFSMEQTCKAALFYFQAGKLDEAERMFRQVLTRQPGHELALRMAGVIAMQRGKQTGGEGAGDAEAEFQWGAKLEIKGEYEKAAGHFRRAIELAPSHPRAHYGLGNVLRSMFDLEGAKEAFEAAIATAPGFAPAYNNLGNVLKDLGEAAEAQEAHEKAARLDPHFAPAFNSLGIYWQERERLDEAIQHFTHAVEIAPNFAAFRSNLAGAYCLAGRAHEAVAEYRLALESQPEAATIHSNLLYTMHLDASVNAQELFLACREWDRRHGAGLMPVNRGYGNDRPVERRLRVGYVSPDFREHAVGRFMLPLLEGHDGNVVETFCYAHGIKADGMTGRLRAAAGNWREITKMSDEEVAERIREDRIDVLVDLTMHAAGCRPLIFARKPAPVQVAYLAYVSTTGMRAMDYRLSDPYLDPVGIDEGVYSEKTVRLPRSYWCYPVPEEAPGVGALPAEGNGYVTFGCLNSFSKVSDETVRLWGKMLLAVKGSRLVIHAPE
ncbi:MAG TPA: tetratricopeptide repeat protein, partial [Phycisphaerae bacterium]